MSEPATALIQLDTARRMLAEAKTLEDVKELRDQAEAIRTYRKAAGHGLAMQNDAAELKLRAERRIGELLAKELAHGGDRRSSFQAGNLKPRLRDLEIKPTQSHRYQQIARVPEPEFEQHLAEVKATPDAELTSAGVLERAKELQRQERAAQRDQREQAQRERPIPPVPAGARLEVAAACALPLDDATVDLIATSPPYGLDKPYPGIPDPALGWDHWMMDWLEEGYRVTKDGGRLALNVPLDTSRGGFRPTYAEAVTAARMAGWTYRSTIVWWDGDINKSTARGSVDSPASPHVIAPVEVIALFSRGHWSQDLPGESDLTHEEWLRWTRGVWTFPGESHSWEGHPAAFPTELPRRLITLLTRRGEVVLDPFVGSGTTVLIAHQLGRRAIGFDRSAEYIASSRRRLAAVEGAV